MTGDALRARRTRRAMTQADLAALLGVSPNTVARWERGELPIRRLSDLALRHVLGGHHEDAGRATRPRRQASSGSPASGHRNGRGD